MDSNPLAGVILFLASSALVLAVDSNPREGVIPSVLASVVGLKKIQTPLRG